MNRAVRSIINRVLLQHFNSTTWFFALRNGDPRINDSTLAEKVDLARRTPVKIMVHPGLDDEYAFLMSEEWAQAIGDLRLGTLADLASCPLAESPQAPETERRSGSLGTTTHRGGLRRGVHAPSFATSNEVTAQPAKA